MDRSADRFELQADYQPAGDQPEAIEQLVEGLESGLSHQTLLGVTGSGKTFSVASVIERVQRPTLVLAHNKTLAAQLYGEFRDYFPRSAVECFVSYYDYYQPEAYVPSSDTYIEKDSSVNEHIEQMRLSATKALLERPDTIIVATVSSIYGLGDPQAYLSMVLHLVRGERIDQRKLLRRLAEMQYTRNDMDLQPGTYRVRGDIVDIFPAESGRDAVRVELFDDQLENLSLIDPLTGSLVGRIPRFTVYPGCRLVHTEAVVSTEKDACAILYDAGLTSPTPDWKTIAWQDTNDELQRVPANSQTTATPALAERPVPRHYYCRVPPRSAPRRRFPGPSRPRDSRRRPRPGVRRARPRWSATLRGCRSPTARQPRRRRQHLW